jgi:acetyl esterase
VVARENTVLTRDILETMNGFSRLLIPLVQKAVRKPKKTCGKELFLPTDAGPVRVLGYNLDRPDTLPLFVDMHGGGFILGHAEMDDPFMSKVAETAGVKILSIDYSLAPQQPFPTALNECHGVVKYAKEHPEELGIDPANIAVGGHSAGGNLGAGICLLDAERNELGLKALILDYPPLDLHTDPYLKPRPKKAIPPRMARVFDAAYCGAREAAKNPLISPCFATVQQLSSFPPTLIISAGQDSLAAEEAVFKDKLEAAGVPVTYRLFEGVPHGFTLRGGPEADEAWQMMIDFLKRRLARSESESTSST